MKESPTTLERKLQKVLGTGSVKANGGCVEIRLRDGWTTEVVRGSSEAAEWLRKTAGRMLDAAETLKPTGPKVGLSVTYPVHFVDIDGEDDLTIEVYNVDTDAQAIQKVRAALAGIVARAKGGEA